MDPLASFSSSAWLNDSLHVPDPLPQTCPSIGQQRKSPSHVGQHVSRRSSSSSLFHSKKVSPSLPPTQSPATTAVRNTRGIGSSPSPSLPQHRSITAGGKSRQTASSSSVASSLGRTAISMATAGKLPNSIIGRGSSQSRFASQHFVLATPRRRSVSSQPSSSLHSLRSSQRPESENDAAGLTTGGMVRSSTPHHHGQSITATTSMGLATPCYSMDDESQQHHRALVLSLRSEITALTNALEREQATVNTWRETAERSSREAQHERTKREEAEAAARATRVQWEGASAQLNARALEEETAAKQLAEREGEWESILKEHAEARHAAEVAASQAEAAKLESDTQRTKQVADMRQRLANVQQEMERELAIRWASAHDKHQQTLEALGQTIEGKEGTGHTEGTGEESSRVLTLLRDECDQLRTQLSAVSLTAANELQQQLDLLRQSHALAVEELAQQHARELTTLQTRAAVASDATQRATEAQRVADELRISHQELQQQYQLKERECMATQEELTILQTRLWDSDKEIKRLLAEAELAVTRAEAEIQSRHAEELQTYLDSLETERSAEEDEWRRQIQWSQQRVTEVEAQLEESQALWGAQRAELVQAEAEAKHKLAQLSQQQQHWTQQRASSTLVDLNSHGQVNEMRRLRSNHKASSSRSQPSLRRSPALQNSTLSRRSSLESQSPEPFPPMPTPSQQQKQQQEDLSKGFVGKRSRSQTLVESTKSSPFEMIHEVNVNQLTPTKRLGMKTNPQSTARPSPSSRIFAYTGFDSKQTVNHLLQSLQDVLPTANTIQVVDSPSNAALPSPVTHVLVAGGGGLTVKLLCGLVKGCWIVPTSYVTSCQQAKQWLPEREYGCVRISSNRTESTTATWNVSPESIQHLLSSLAQSTFVFTSLFSQGPHGDALGIVLRAAGATVLEQTYTTTNTLVNLNELNALVQTSSIQQHFLVCTEDEWETCSSKMDQDQWTCTSWDQLVNQWYPNPLM